MFTTLDISTSGLVAQRVRLNTISSNLANVSTQMNEAGENVPYQPRFVVFQTDDDLRTDSGGIGVKVQSVEASDKQPRLKYEPNHPLANGDGYVAYPNIDLTSEFVDAVEASRAYEANVGVIEVTKDLQQNTLRILA